MGISENIKILRERYRLSQRELGQIAGVSDKAVSTWEKGIKEPRMGAIQKMADYFGIQKSNIIEENGLREDHSPEAPAPAPASPPFELTDDEKTLINKYRTLTPTNKSAINSQIDFMLFQQELDVQKEGLCSAS